MSNPAKTTQGLLISRIGQVSRLMGRLLERKLAPIGITYQEMRIAGLLMGDDDITQKDLAEKLSVRAATLSVAISKLEKQGIVKRVASTTDKRVNFLQIIPSKRVSEVDNLLLDVEKDITRGITRKDLQTTGRVLDLLAANLQQAQYQEPPQ